MNPDFTAVFWKEWKEILLQRSAGGGGLRPLIVVGVIGILLPVQMGPQRFFGLQPLLMVTIVSLAAISAVVADAFAGEKERHTLETLLASRLPDSAILFGKMAACLAYGWLISIITIVLGIITVNVANWNGHLLLYRDTASWLGLIFGPPLLGAGVTAAGVFVSLRAATVRNAQQTLSLALVVIFLGMSLGAGALPADVKRWFTQILVTWSATQLILAAIAVVAAIDVVLVLGAMGRFQRSKLILD
jgi:ABC-2 type transport system permease protein